MERSVATTTLPRQAEVPDSMAPQPGLDPALGEPSTLGQGVEPVPFPGGRGLVPAVPTHSLAHCMNFAMGNLQERAMLIRGCAFGNTEEGAIILGSASKADTLAIMPLGPDDQWIRVYSDRGISSQPDDRYLSYMVGTFRELAADLLDSFSDLEVLQGLDILQDLGLAGPDGQVAREVEDLDALLDAAAMKSRALFHEAPGLQQAQSTREPGTEPAAAASREQELGVLLAVAKAGQQQVEQARAMALDLVLAKLSEWLRQAAWGTAQFELWRDTDESDPLHYGRLGWDFYAAGEESEFPTLQGPEGPEDFVALLDRYVEVLPASGTYTFDGQRLSEGMNPLP